VDIRSAGSGRKIVTTALLALVLSAAPIELEPRAVPADAVISAYQLPTALRAKAEAHAQAGHWVYGMDAVWGLVILLGVTRLRVGPAIQRWAARRTGRPWLQSVLFAPPFLLLIAVLGLPTAIAAHQIERHFGLSIQGWGSFARDWAIGQAIGLVFGAFLVWLLYAVMRKSPRRWWAWVWAAVLPVLLFVMFIEPLVIEPLFFHFSPLATEHAPLADRLRAIAMKGGEEIPLDRMFLMDASEKLRSVNAYVTGIGASKRVVVWDTTLSAMTDDEIAFVFGHELGHYVLGHVLKGFAVAALGILVALWIASRVLAAWLRSERWGIGRLDEPASLPLFLVLFSVLGLLSSPLGGAVSRHFEHQADAFGLEATREVNANVSQAAAHAFQRLGEIDLAEPDPNPFIVWWFYDHPPVRDRVAFVLGL
jgi:Zn-dependent protease with chaperone function